MVCNYIVYVMSAKSKTKKQTKNWIYSQMFSCLQNYTKVKNDIVLQNS